MHSQRIALLLSAVVGIIGTFLPYMKSWFNSATLFEAHDGSGYMIIAAFVISAIVALIGNEKNAITSGQLAGAIIPGIIPGTLLLILLLGSKQNDFARIFTNFEIGFYLVLIASLSILISGLALVTDKIATANLKQSDPIFCSECGKKYPPSLVGSFCEECGNKL